MSSSFSLSNRGLMVFKALEKSKNMKVKLTPGAFELWVLFRLLSNKTFKC